MIGNSTTLKARDVNEALGGVLKVVSFYGSRRTGESNGTISIRN